MDGDDARLVVVLVRPLSPLSASWASLMTDGALWTVLPRLGHVYSASLVRPLLPVALLILQHPTESIPLIFTR